MNLKTTDYVGAGSIDETDQFVWCADVKLGRTWVLCVLVGFAPALVQNTVTLSSPCANNLVLSNGPIFCIPKLL